MMTLEGGLFSKMKGMENLSLLSAAFGDAVRAVERLEAHYETVGDSYRLNAVARELEGMEEDFSEIERIVSGYLNSSLSQSGALSVSRTVPAGQSAIKEQSERLEKEISMREQEITKVLHDLEKTYAGCQKQLEQKLTPKEPQRNEQFQGGESATVENIVNTSVKRSEEQEQNGNLRIQSSTPFQPCSSSTTVNSSGAAVFYPSSSFVYSSTSDTSQFSMSYKPSVWDHPLYFQQPPLNARLNSAQTTLVASSSQLYMPAAQAHTSFQPLSSSTVFDPYCQSALKLQL